MDTQVLTVTSKGQIFIPINIRKKLSIDTGDSLVAYATDDAIFLKTLKAIVSNKVTACASKRIVEEYIKIVNEMISRK